MKGQLGEKVVAETLVEVEIVHSVEYCRMLQEIRQGQMVLRDLAAQGSLVTLLGQNWAEHRKEVPELAGVLDRTGQDW